MNTYICVFVSPLPLVLRVGCCKNRSESRGPPKHSQRLHPTTIGTSYAILQGQCLRTAQNPPRNLETALHCSSSRSCPTETLNSRLTSELCAFSTILAVCDAQVTRCVVKTRMLVHVTADLLTKQCERRKQVQLVVQQQGTEGFYTVTCYVLSASSLESRLCIASAI